MERYRISTEGSVYYVTFSVVQWLPIFVSETSCKIVADSLNFCHQRKHLRINAYVIMPTHMHAILFDAGGDAARLEATLHDFRKFTGRQLADHCVHHFPTCFSETMRAAAGPDRERRLWQPTRHPVIIETERFFLEKLCYLHENPCRKGLVLRAADWRFSSASHFISDGQVANDVTLTQLAW